MKVLKNILFVMLFSFSVVSHAQITDKLVITANELVSQSEKGFDRLKWQTDFTTTEIGKPELPVYRVSYVLPVDAVVTGVSFLVQVKQKIDRTFYIFPYQEPLTTDNTSPLVFTTPDLNVYQSDTPYPNKIYDIESDEFLHGYHVVTLRIYPFEYLPKTKVLNYYSQLSFQIDYAIKPNDTEIKPLTQTVYRAGLCEKFVKFQVRNPEQVSVFGSNVQSLSDVKTRLSVKTGIQKVQSLKVTDEITPDYIIVTNNALKSTFKKLADWKTKKGLFSIIKTVEDIDLSYKGNDIQEKIRNYLIECYSKWGAGIYVLLGGDSKIVLPRMVLGNNNYLNAADLYYATYSGSWNANMNSVFLESADYPNFSTGMILGRAPVENVSEASIFVDKIIAYEKASGIPSLSYLKNNLYVDAYLGQTGSSLNTFSQADVKSFIANYVPSSINSKFMCDNASCTGSTTRYSVTPCPGGNIELNRDNFLGALNSGANLGVGKFHFIYHMDHCSSNAVSTSGIDKGQNVGINDMSSLSNGTSYQIFMCGGCHSADFTTNCIAESYITNPTGGGVCWIGNTDVGLASEIVQLKYFCDAIYSTTGHPSLGRYDIGSAYQNVIKKNSVDPWRLHLLGDPEMQVWTNVPANLSAAVSPSSLGLGLQTLNITISNLSSGSKASICIQKGDEIYVLKEVTANGTYPVPVRVETPGSVSITITSHDFIPYETTINANSAINPNIIVSSVDFVDNGTSGSIGDGNGKNDAGETVVLNVELNNNGGSLADSIKATLTCNYSSIGITLLGSTTATYGAIPAGGKTTKSFKYKLSKDIAEILANSPSPVTFTLTISGAKKQNWQKTFNIDVFNSLIKLCNKTVLSTTDGDLIIEPNENVTFNIDLQNFGFSLARGLSAVLSSNGGTAIQSCTSTPVSYANISRYDTKSGLSTFQFKTSASYTVGAALNFNLIITNEYGMSWNYSFNLLEKPTEVVNLSFNSDAAEIDLKWIRVINAVGYNIYRCNVGANDTELGNYVKLNLLPVSSAYFNDLSNLSVLTKYYYKVAAVSSTGNEGAMTRILAWTSYPRKSSFPIAFDTSVGYVSTFINTVDVNLDGKKEIFSANKLGSVIGMDCYGNELYNIDNNVTSYVGITQLGSQLTGVPAVGDMNKDGNRQFVVASRNYQQDNTIYCYSVTDQLPSDGKPDELWKKFTPAKQYNRGVILSNVDNSLDGSLEVVTNSDERGSISVYDKNGTLLSDIPCVNTYGAIAVTDLDGDGDAEIIQGSGTGIHVWHHNGTSYRGSASLYTLSIAGYRFAGSVVTCDINNDGSPEILTFALKETTPYQAKLFAIKKDGTLVPGFDGSQTIPINSNWAMELAVGDLNRDGNLEVVAFANDGIKVWNKSGQPVTPISSTSISDIAVAATPILADVDGKLVNGQPDVEIIYGSGNFIQAYKMDGSKVLGFPLKPRNGANSFINVSDVDADGKNELISASQNDIDMWQTGGMPSAIEWGCERHDAQNTGAYGPLCEAMLVKDNTIWSTGNNICGDLIVKSAKLTIQNNAKITMSPSSVIIVMSGGTLEVNASQIVNANIKLQSGGTLRILNNGIITLKGELNTDLNSQIEIISGEIVR